MQNSGLFDSAKQPNESTNEEIKKTRRNFRRMQKIKLLIINDTDVFKTEIINVMLKQLMYLYMKCIYDYFVPLYTCNPYPIMRCKCKKCMSLFRPYDPLSIYYKLFIYIHLKVYPLMYSKYILGNAIYYIHIKLLLLYKRIT